MSVLGNRKFYDFEKETRSDNSDTADVKKKDELLKYINDNVIGSGTVFSSPFGKRKVTYCDYTASGRSLKFIEDYIMQQVLPHYGSTHTTTSVTSLQTSLFRHEARDIIRNAVRASEHDRIIFTGSGATGAINKLVHGLKLEKPPIVFVDFTAHHSFLLPWREKGALVIKIREDANGCLDLDHLERSLKIYQKSERQMIGCFSAASNITGVLIDQNSATVLLHRYGALAFWDFATAAPYVDICMNPRTTDTSDQLAHKDAIFFSLHKFVGGVQTPGVLICKREMLQNEVPSECGGGTVFFVSHEGHRYLKDEEEREEGGTPSIVESIRGGMVMQLKMSLGPQVITSRCELLRKRIEEFLDSTPDIHPLGNMCASDRLPILSFMVKHRRSGPFLHHNFVSAVLNDLFGIQSRGGCACAGTYAQDLLGIDPALASRYENILLEDPSLDRSHLRRREEHGSHEVLRPGFVRVNLPFTASDDQVEFILSALRSVSENAWKLLPQYIFNPETGEWKHHTNLVFKNRQWLQNISYSSGSFEANLKKTPEEAPSYSEVLLEAENVWKETAKVSQRLKVPDQGVLFEGEAQTLRWFLLPSEAQKLMAKENQSDSALIEPPFSVLSYPLSSDMLDNRPDYIWTRGKALLNTSSTSILESLKNEDLNNGHCLSRNGSQSIKSDPILTVKEPLKMQQSGISCLIGDKQIELSESLNNKSTKENSLNQSPTQVKSSNSEVKRTAVQNSVVCPDVKCEIKKEVIPLNMMTSKNPRKLLWASPPKCIFNPTTEAINKFSMIKNQDKVLVCLSGGKDSLSLLHTLRQYQFYSKSNGVHFTLGAVTVDPQSSSYDPRPLVPYLASLGVPYFYEEQGILKQAECVDELNSICSFCSRMKRGRIYASARRNGFNVLALGQHLDDLAESFLMSTFHNGRLRTMKASYDVKEGDLRVIRPFVYVREKDLREFAESRKLPIIPENCPACFEAPKERHRVKQLLAQQEVLFPNLFNSLRTALAPLFGINRTGLENELFGKNSTPSGPTEVQEDSDQD